MRRPQAWQAAAKVTLRLLSSNCFSSPSSSAAALAKVLQPTGAKRPIRRNTQTMAQPAPAPAANLEQLAGLVGEKRGARPITPQHTGGLLRDSCGISGQRGRRHGFRSATHCCRPYTHTYMYTHTRPGLVCLYRSPICSMQSRRCCTHVPAARLNLSPRDPCPTAALAACNRPQTPQTHPCLSTSQPEPEPCLCFPRLNNPHSQLQ